MAYILKYCSRRVNKRSFIVVPDSCPQRDLCLMSFIHVSSVYIQAHCRIKVGVTNLKIIFPVDPDLSLSRGLMEPFTCPQEDQKNPRRNKGFK